MIDIKIDGQSLDLRPNTVISYTRNSAVFSSAETGQLPGSYSFPFSLPPTGNNLRLLRHPTYLNTTDVLPESGCEIYFNGIQLPFTGKINIQSADEKDIQAYVVANAMTDLKEVKLADLNLGGVRAIGNQTAMLAHAKATALTPLAYDYVFFPVHSREWQTGKTTPININNWDTVAQAFAISSSNPALVPFIRIEYLLNKIFERTNYAFRNQFQVTDELRNLVLINIYSLWSKDVMSPTIDLTNHVPDITCADFLRRITSLFCIGLFDNVFSKTIKMVPMRTVLAADPMHDWTAKTHARFQTSFEKTEIPTTFRYLEDPNDKIFERFRPLRKPTEFSVIQNTDDILLQPFNEHYYIIANNEYWLNDPIRQRMVFSELGSAPPLGTGPKIRTGAFTPPVLESNLVPLMDLHDYFNTPNYTNTQMPVLDQAGNVTLQDGVDENNDPVWVEQKNPNPVRFTCYRGFWGDGQANYYPLGSGLRYGPLGQVLGNYSLRWDQPDGIYQQWWQRWHNSLGGRLIARKINLSAADLVAFDFGQKVRIDNLDYFVRSMKVTLTMSGIEPTEVSMISTI